MSQDLAYVQLIKGLIEDTEAQRFVEETVTRSSMTGWDDAIQQSSGSNLQERTGFAPDHGWQEPAPAQQHAFLTDGHRAMEGQVDRAELYSGAQGGSITAPTNKAPLSPTAYEFQKDSGTTANGERTGESNNGRPGWHGDESQPVSKPNATQLQEQQPIQAFMHSSYGQGHPSSADPASSQHKNFSRTVATQSGYGGPSNDPDKFYDRFQNPRQQMHASQPAIRTQHSWLAQGQGLQPRHQRPVGRFESDRNGSGYNHQQTYDKQTGPGSQSSYARGPPASQARGNDQRSRQASWEGHGGQFERPPSSLEAEPAPFSAPQAGTHAIASGQPYLRTAFRPPSRPASQASRRDDGWAGHAPVSTAGPQTGVWWDGDQQNHGREHLPSPARQGQDHKPTERLLRPPAMGRDMASHQAMGHDDGAPVWGQAPQPRQYGTFQTEMPSIRTENVPSKNDLRHKRSSGPERQDYGPNEQRQSFGYLMDAEISRQGVANDRGQFASTARTASQTSAAPAQPARPMPPGQQRDIRWNSNPSQHSHVSQEGWQQNRPAIHTPNAHIPPRPELSHVEQQADSRPYERSSGPNVSKPAAQPDASGWHPKALAPQSKDLGWDSAPAMQQSLSAHGWEAPSPSRDAARARDAAIRTQVDDSHKGSMERPDSRQPQQRPEQDRAWDAPRVSQPPPAAQFDSCDSGRSLGTSPAPPAEIKATTGWGGANNSLPPQHRGDDTQFGATSTEAFVEPPSDHKAMLERLRKTAAALKGPSRAQLMENARRAGAAEPPPPSSKPDALPPRPSYGIDFASSREQPRAQNVGYAGGSAGMQQDRPADSGFYRHQSNDNAFSGQEGTRVYPPTDDRQRSHGEQSYSLGPLGPGHSARGHAARAANEPRPPSQAYDAPSGMSAGWGSGTAASKAGALHSSSVHDTSGWEGMQSSKPPAAPAAHDASGWDRPLRPTSRPSEASEQSVKPAPNSGADIGMKDGDRPAFHEREAAPVLKPAQQRGAPHEVRPTSTPEVAACSAGGWDAFVPADLPPAHGNSGWETTSYEAQRRTPTDGVGQAKRSVTPSALAPSEVPSAKHESTPIVGQPSGPETTNVAGGGEAVPPASGPAKAATAVPSQGAHEVERPARQPTGDAGSPDFSQAQGERSSADEQGGTVPEGAGWESGTGEIVGKQHVEDVPFGEPVMLTREQRMAKMKNALDHLGPIVSRKELFDNAQKEEEERKARREARDAEAEAQGKPVRRAAPIFEEDCSGWGEPDPGKVLTMGAWNDLPLAPLKPIVKIANSPAVESSTGWQIPNDKPSADIDRSEPPKQSAPKQADEAPQKQSREERQKQSDDDPQEQLRVGPQKLSGAGSASREASSIGQTSEPRPDTSATSEAEGPPEDFSQHLVKAWEEAGISAQATSSPSQDDSKPPTPAHHEVESSGHAKDSKALQSVASERTATIENPAIEAQAAIQPEAPDESPEGLEASPILAMVDGKTCRDDGPVEVQTSLHETDEKPDTLNSEGASNSKDSEGSKIGHHTRGLELAACISIIKLVPNISGVAKPSESPQPLLPEHIPAEPEPLPEASKLDSRLPAAQNLERAPPALLLPVPTVISLSSFDHTQQPADKPPTPGVGIENGEELAGTASLVCAPDHRDAPPEVAQSPSDEYQTGLVPCVPPLQSVFEASSVKTVEDLEPYPTTSAQPESSDKNGFGSNAPSTQSRNEGAALSVPQNAPTAEEGCQGKVIAECVVMNPASQKVNEAELNSKGNAVERVPTVGDTTASEQHHSPEGSESATLGKTSDGQDNGQREGRPLALLVESITDAILEKDGASQQSAGD